MLPLSSLPFHRLHKIPQQFILNLQPGILFLIVVYCLVRFGPTFRQRRYLLQLGFWPKPTPTLYAVSANAVFSADLPLAPTRRQLLPDFILYACRLLFHSLFSWHNNTPDVVLLSYIRGLFVYCPFLLVQFHSSGFCFMSYYILFLLRNYASSRSNFFFKEIKAFFSILET